MVLRKKKTTIVLVAAVTLSLLLLYPVCNAYAALIELDAPANITVSGTVISWDKVENADGYYISIGVGTDSEGMHTGKSINSGDVTSYDFKDRVISLMSSAGYTDSSELNLYLEVSAKTNNTETYSNSDGSKLVIPLSETGVDIQKSRLDAPANVRVSGTVLLWDKVQNADGYYISIGVGTDSEGMHTGRRINSGDVTSYDFEDTVSELMSSAGYADSNELKLIAEVSAVANNTGAYSNSNASKLVVPLTETGISIQRNKLDTPSNFRLENTILLWDDVKNADYYNVSITLVKDGSGMTTSYADGRPTESYYDIDAGVRYTLSVAGFTDLNGVEVRVRVQACSDNKESYVNSDAGTFVEYEYNGPHNWETTYTVDVKPTCIAEGSESIHCSTCGAVKDGSERVIPKAAHIYGAWKTTKAPTQTATGVKTRTCTKCGAKQTATIDMLPKMTLSKTSYVWNNTVQTPTVYVKIGSKTLPKSYYTVTYPKGRKNVGTYTIKVTLKNGYSGTGSASYTIKPKGTGLTGVTAASKAATVKWTKQTAKMSTARITGYQIQYSLKKDFKSGNKAVNVGGYTNTSRKITGLSSNKTYYFRVRTYLKSGSKTYYSGWSKDRTVKVK